MYKPTFQFVEHYLEFIGGFRNHDGTKLFLFDTVPPPVSLARYDVKIIQSMCVQTAEMSRALTDKQAALAVKLVEKYKRQLGNLEPAVILPEKLDCFEYGIRYVDRSKTVWMHGDVIQIKFPYDTTLISVVRRLLVDGQGSVEFDNEEKIWRLELTEYMINWIMTVLPKFDFVIDPEIIKYYDRILEIEKQNFRILLTNDNEKFSILNANNSLLDYIENHVGNLSWENLVKLVDYASVLGYEVDETLKTIVQTNYSKFYKIIENKNVELSTNDFTVDNIVEYATLTNRLPIYFYDTSTSKPNTEKIIYINKNAPDNLEAKLLVTRTPLMIGSKKQSWLASAEKTIILV